MAEPTLSGYQQSTWTDTSSSAETTPSITWSAGDFIVVLGASEDNSNVLDTPTATGLTFSAVTSTPTNVSSNCKLFAWTATAGAGGSGAVTANHNSSPSGTFTAGIAVFVFSGSDGLGNTAIEAGLASTLTKSLTRGSNNSAVVQVWADWDVSSATVTWTPTGQTQRVASQVASHATFWVANWADQGSAGSTSYGFSSGSGTALSTIALEIKGTAGGGGRTTKNTRSAPLGIEVGMNWRGGNL